MPQQTDNTANGGSAPIAPDTHTAPIGDAGAELAEALVRAAWRLRKNERKVLAPHGLTFAQARALRLLVRTGPMRVGDLADRLEIVPRSATTRVDGLEEAGLVTRTPDPTDRRSILVEPTPQGHDLVTTLAAGRRATAESLLAPLSPDERADLIRLLTRLTKET